jgi:hypothetical protein
MKAFDAASIYQRYVDKLSQNPDWKAVLGDSVVSAVLKAVAEVQAETVRYSEHMYKETKWDTAQNTSSIVAAAGQLGYKPARRKSAFGEIYISADPRTHLVGRAIFRDAFLSLTSSSPQIAGWKTLTEEINFSKNATVVDSKGNSYILTSLRPLEASSTTYSDNLFGFPSHAAYTRNTIIQGVHKSIEIPIDVARAISTRSKLDPYVFIPVEIRDCEDANTALTRSLFRVFSVKTSGEEEEYRVVDTLHFSNSTDRDVEVYNDLYNKDVLYLKFNASSNRGRVMNLSTGSGIDHLRVDYVESLGSAGNVSSAFEQFTVSDIPEHPGLKLYGINLDPIIGGADEETVYDIKQNAPRYYMNTYTVATKEAYENIIKRIDFSGEYASKVRVFARTSENEDSEVRQRITWATMILPSLEDLATSTEDNPYSEIERLINYYLTELKAPTDVIRFTPPRYVGFGVGINCTADRAQVDNLSALKRDIRDTVDAAYGSRSSLLDFKRPVYSADIISSLKSSFPALKSVKIELEAVTKLNWNNTQRIQPVPGTTNPIRTLRIPFSFNSLFNGTGLRRGFKDYQTGAAYVLRVDIFYKQSPSSNLPPYHVSIFVKEDPTRTKKAFYYMQDGAENATIWPEGLVEGNYPFFSPEVYDRLDEGYQFYFKKKYYTDLEFEELVSNEALTQERVLSTYRQTPGALNSYLIWWGENEDETEDDAGDGFFEFDIESFYYTLQKCAEQDTYLQSALSPYEFSYVRCDAASSEILNGFVKDVLANYIDIYVSMRPLDSDIVFTDAETNNDVVLYIDSQDQLSIEGSATEASQSRRNRLISVECDLI